jgi:tetratricopeptide (TPR) repeat protein
VCIVLSPAERTVATSDTVDSRLPGSGRTLLELEAAAQLTPESARYGYVYAVALNGVGQPKQAIQALERVLARHPYDRDTLAALVAYVREQNRPLQALPNARRLADMEPANAEARQLVERLEAETAGRSRHPVESWVWLARAVGAQNYSSRMLALTLAISSGVTSRIPCCLACSPAFLTTSSTDSPRTTCLQPLEGSTFAHSRIFATAMPPLFRERELLCEVWLWLSPWSRCAPGAARNAAPPKLAGAGHDVNQ